MRILVVGASGRMGQEIHKVSRQHYKDYSLMGVARSGSAEHYVRVEKSILTYDPAEFDVIVDFSLQEAFADTVKLATIKKRPLVSGVTGLAPQELDLLKQASKEIPVLWSSNMSLGIAVLKKALSAFAPISDFDFQIEEFHHNKKRDNPSGTALTLQEELNHVTKKTNPTPIGIRGGGIFGIHKVWAMSEEETLCFEHQALSRSVFAKGALTCAKWLKDKELGLYSINDVL
ncbi:MAG: 4-hydroxy-tetrahydrodipicolinate reductase [Bdellovibrionia bacterium]